MRYPNDRQRHSIVGATGSGKTHAALWHLSRRSFHQKPWIIYDFKFDDLINDIDGVEEISVTDRIPDQPGLYIVHPKPHEEEQVEQQMWAIWERGNTGVYIDEGYMVGLNNRAFRALLTQGRSKHIPIIVLSQRPVWMDRFVFSESEFFQIFRLQHRKDQQNVEQFVPANLSHRLPEYHSYYYDVGEDKLVILKPVPNRDVIFKTFRDRLARIKKVI
jgi:hypothetical protein